MSFVCRDRAQQQIGKWRLGFIGLLVLMGGAVGTGIFALGPEAVNSPTPQSGANPGKPPATAALPAPAPAQPLDQVLQWLYQARKNYTAVRDYSGTLIKQERVQGKLQEQNIIYLKFRVNPFSVYMRWLSPRESAGQEVAFIFGRNNNKMRVRFPKGLKGAIGWVAVDPNDQRVFQHSRHTIYEAGIGNLLEQVIQNLELEKRLNKSQIGVKEYTYNNRPCYRVEATRTERNVRSYSYRSVFFLDKESKLPIRNENYDWPQAGGTPVGELMEVFSFVDLRFNTGLSDADFAR